MQTTYDKKICRNIKKSNINNSIKSNIGSYNIKNIKNKGVESFNNKVKIFSTNPIKEISPLPTNLIEIKEQDNSYCESNTRNKNINENKGNKLNNTQESHFKINEKRPSSDSNFEKESKKMIRESSPSYGPNYEKKERKKSSEEKLNNTKNTNNNDSYTFKLNVNKRKGRASVDNIVSDSKKKLKNKINLNEKRNSAKIFYNKNKIKQEKGIKSKKNNKNNQNSSNKLNSLLSHDSNNINFLEGEDIIYENSLLNNIRSFGNNQDYQSGQAKEKKKENLIIKINKNISKEDIDKNIEESSSSSINSKKKKK